MNVLVVEDDRDHRAVIRILLQLAGYEVRDAASAEDALMVFETWRPDAVVLDVRLPGLDGLELLTIIRVSAELATLAVVLCSAHAESSAADAARDDPLTGFVAKPYHPDRLLAELTTVLDAMSGLGQPVTPS